MGGSDTASLDDGASRDFPAHRVLGQAGIYGRENVANRERLPASGATLIALPMKITGRSDGPTRVITILPLPLGAARPGTLPARSPHPGEGFILRASAFRRRLPSPPGLMRWPSVSVWRGCRLR
jgi:hypothetical protein